MALRNTDISVLDRMLLLLVCCKDCIGAVSVAPIEGEEESIAKVSLLLSPASSGGWRFASGLCKENFSN